MLHGSLQKRLALSIDGYCELQEDVLDKCEIFATQVDENFPIRFQILKDALGDSTYTKTLMLERNPFKVYRVGSNPERVAFDRVKVTDGL